MYNNSYDLSDLGFKCTKDREVIIIDNIEDLIYDQDNYNPLKDYFVYFNKNSNELISADKFKKYLSDIVPDVTEIMDIEKTNLESVESVDDVNKIINKYSLKFSELTNIDKNHISNNIITNINRIKTN